jgi:hypothetical protein
MEQIETATIALCSSSPHVILGATVKKLLPSNSSVQWNVKKVFMQIPLYTMCKNPTDLARPRMKSSLT